jgi:hypothetical protein
MTALRLMRTIVMTSRIKLFVFRQERVEISTHVQTQDYL